MLEKAAFFIVFITTLQSMASHASTAVTPDSLIHQVDLMLETVEDDILNKLSDQFEEAKKDNQEAVEEAIGRADRIAQLEKEREDMLFRRQLLLDKVEDWARSDALILDEYVSTDDLNEAMAKAHAIAAYFGLDVPKLQKLYSLGKKTIRDAEFGLQEGNPPLKEAIDSAFYNQFFIYAVDRTEEIALAQAETQRYKVGLYKRVTLAYLRALLASAERPPECEPKDSGKTLKLKGMTIRTFDCRDPVLENLRRYILAVQQVASADSDLFGSYADIVIAEQSLTNDISASIPLVGDAIDFYSLYAGEDMAGRCLSRTDMAITALFAAIPFVPASWMTQIVRRTPIEAGMEKMAKMISWVAESATWSSTTMRQFALSRGLTVDQLKGFDSFIAKGQSFLVADISMSSRGIEIKPGQTEQITGITRLKDDLSAQQIVQRNTMMAYHEQIQFRDLPQSVRERMKRTSQRIQDANLNRAQHGRAHVIDQSNMVPEHLEAFERMAKDKDAVVAFRYVNPNATKLIAADAATKWMDVKPKSSNWGPHRGYLPYDQKFSKIMNPDALKAMSPDEFAEAAAKAVEYSDLAKKCTKDPRCFKMELVLPSGDSVHILTRADGTEIPILKTPEGKLLDPDSMSAVDIGDGSLRPMEVMAAKNKKGELAPLTADYDLLAVGTKSDVQRADYTPETGFRTAEEDAAIGWVNEYGEAAGYQGGNLSHHGPENQFYKSPGALAEDSVMTAVDPIRGITTIPRCDIECMKQWCKSSGQCGRTPICTKATPMPCITIDPDRLLKDYFNEMRMAGYTNLRPNEVWNWGKSNGLSGWSPILMLEPPKGKIKAKLGQYRPRQGIVETANEIPIERMLPAARKSAAAALEYLFSCPEVSLRQSAHNWVEGKPQ